MNIMVYKDGQTKKKKFSNKILNANDFLTLASRWKDNFVKRQHADVFN